MVVALSREEALSHPRRSALHAVVCESPGMGLRALSSRVGIPVGTTRHHLNVLLRSGLLREARVGVALAFMPAGDDRNAGHVALLREPGLVELRDVVASMGRVCQRDLLDSLTWPRSTTQHRLDRLVEAGLLRVRPQGRYLFYEVTQ